MNATTTLIKLSKAHVLRIVMVFLMLLSSLIPIRPALAEETALVGLDGFKQLAAGLSHTVALKSDGTVWTWGDNQRGKLGAGTVVNRYAPSRLKDLTDVKAVAAGMNHTLAVKKDGTVWAWGANNAGQLGDGTKTDRGTPAKIDGLSNIISVAAGVNHSVALRDDGVVFAWGENAKGQLGDNTTVDHDTPQQVVDLPPITSISSGANHVLAVTTDTEVVAWGDNANGQIGNGYTGGYNKYRVFSKFMRGTQAVAAGSNFSLALKEDGTVCSWGSNSVGQLGRDYRYAVSADPTPVSGLTGITAIAGGNTHGIAVTQDGDVYTWGANNFGQLGIGNYDKKTVVTRVFDIDKVTAVSAGSFHSLAMKADGSVWAWGNNTMGQLGDGTTTNRILPVLLPRFSLVASLPGATTASPSYTNTAAPALIAAGDSFTQAVKNGKVWSWGENVYGQLGLGSTVFKNSPQPNDRIADTVVLAAGPAHAVALKSDGTVMSWGQNVFGQLGDASNQGKNIPTSLPIPDVASVAAGSNFTLFLKKDASVWGTGDNTFGQQADGTADPRNVPAKIEGLPLIQAVAAGYYHSLALTPDGNVWAWGDNSFGQLGDGTVTPRRVPVPVTKLSNVIAVAAGRNFSLALKADGTVWAWGNNTYGQLGDGTNTNRNEPVPVSFLTQVSAIAGGSYHALAIKADGTVWSWGNNSFGQLGDGTTSNRVSPVQAKALSGARYIAAGSYHSASMDEAGTVWTWGSNGSGQLGDGGFKSRSVPAVVSGFRPSFKDTIGHWAQGSIDAAVEKNMVDGYPDATFQPDNPISRSELVKFTASALKLNVASPAAGQSWFAPYENAMKNAGILGLDDIQGAWEEPATRAELARLAVRAVSKELQTPNTSIESGFAMQTAVKKGILQGLSGGRLAPEEKTTRAQAIVVMERILSVNAGVDLSQEAAAVQSSP